VGQRDSELAELISTALSAEQQARVEALKATREVMRETKGFMGSSAGTDVDDLIHMARFILSGKRNWRKSDVYDNYNETPSEDGQVSPLMKVPSPRSTGG
jgi:hypothetical protein